MLEVKNLHAYYGDSHIIHDLSLQVDTGETVALLGRNGAGKSTTLRSIMNIGPRREGEITFQGESIKDLSADQIFKRGISWVPETRRVFQNLTVEDNLNMGKKNSDDTFDYVLDLFPRLEERMNQKAGTLSGGEQQMLTIGRSLVSEPDFLLIDEPLEGLMPKLVTVVSEAIQELRERGYSVLIAEQMPDVILDIADRVYIIDKGQIAFSGTTTELSENDEYIDRYLLGGEQ